MSQFNKAKFAKDIKMYRGSTPASERYRDKLTFKDLERISGIHYMVWHRAELEVGETSISNFLVMCDIMSKDPQSYYLKPARS